MFLSLFGVCMVYVLLWMLENH